VLTGHDFNELLCIRSIAITKLGEAVNESLNLYDSCFWNWSCVFHNSDFNKLNIHWFVKDSTNDLIFLIYFTFFNKKSTALNM